jgi:hypothetical protein
MRTLFFIIAIALAAQESEALTAMNVADIQAIVVKALQQPVTLTEQERMQAIVMLEQVSEHEQDVLTKDIQMFYDADANAFPWGIRQRDDYVTGR